MAGGRIKGITIEIDGSTTGLNKALKETESSLSSTQRSLKDVNRLLKVDPTSTELLSQKQKLLAQAVGDTKTKLDSLKQASEQAAKTAGNYDAWKEKYDPLQKEVDETKTKLQELKQKQEDLEKSGNIDTEEYKKLQQEVDNTNSHLKDLKAQQKLVDEEFGKPISPEKFDALQREITETEQNLKSLEKQAERASSVIGTVMQEAGSKLKDTGSKISGAGTNMLTVTAGFAAAGGAAIKYASDTEESVNKVDVAFGKSAGKVKEFAESALENFGMAKGSALDAAATFGDMGTSMGLSKKSAADMAISLTGLGGDLASFKNIGVDQAMTALNGVFTGETESLKQLGIVMTQTNLDAFAMANGFGKTTKEMTEAEKVQLRYAYVMDATKNAQGDFARTSDGTANALRTSQEGAKELAASFGEMLLPAIANILGKVNDVIKYFSNMDDKTKKVIITIAGIIAVVGPALIIIGNIISAIGIITGAIGTLMSAGLLPVIPIIAGVVAAGVLLYKNWDTIKEKAGQLKENVINKISEMKENASEKWTSMKEEASEKWDSMKNTVTEKLSSMKQGAASKYSEIKQKASESWNNMKNDVKEKWTNMSSSMSEKLSSMKQSASTKYSEIKKNASESWASMKQNMSDKLSEMKASYDSHGGGLKGSVSAVLTGIKGLYSDEYKAIDTLTGGKLSEIASKFSKHLGSAKSTVQDKLGGIGDKFSSTMKDAKNKVSDAIDSIKKKFNFSWSLPKLKLPHLSISGKFSINPPSVPKFGIKWYRKAMDSAIVLSSPTAFGYDSKTHQLLAGGEAGREVVSGEEHLVNLIGNVVSSKYDKLERQLDQLNSVVEYYFPNVLKKMDRDIVLDDGTLVGKMASEMDVRLGIIAGRKERGN